MVRASRGEPGSERMRAPAIRGSPTGAPAIPTVFAKTTGEGLQALEETMATTLKPARWA